MIGIQLFVMSGTEEEQYMKPQHYPSLHWTERKVVRQQYIQEQGGLCYYCSCPLGIKPKMDKKINWKLFPPNFLKYPVHLHHCHDTGMTIGAVHAYCNAVLWQYHGE